MELKADIFAISSRTSSAGSLPTRKTTSLKTTFRHCLLTVALLTAAVPAWCAKEAPIAEMPKTVNINTADAATLAEVLKGVGLAKAEAIIAYRKEHGSFKSAEQLADVKGIGEKLVEANQGRITVK